MMRAWLRRLQLRWLQRLLSKELEQIYRLAKEASCRSQDAQKTKDHFHTAYWAGQRDGLWTAAHWLDQIRSGKSTLLTIQDVMTITHHCSQQGLQKEKE